MMTLEELLDTVPKDRREEEERRVGLKLCERPEEYIRAIDGQRLSPEVIGWLGANVGGEA
jgi:hypothetical protein